MTEKTKTRKQAIADGDLFDLSNEPGLEEVIRASGVRLPIAATRAVALEVGPFCIGEMLDAFRAATLADGGNDDTVLFRLDDGAEGLRLRAYICGDDDGKPVVTILREEEEYPCREP